jgi:nucleophosmin 1
MVKLNTSQMSTGSKMGVFPDTGAASKEYFWGCTLTKESPEVLWTFEEEEDDMDYMQHTLFLRHAVLGAGVSEDERHILQVETKTFNDELIKTPIASLKLGTHDMCNLDMNFTHEVPVTFRLLSGSGPVHLSAQHLVEFPPEEGEEFDYTEGEATEDEEESEAAAKKRKAGGAGAQKKAKRGKLDSSAVSENASGDDESMEEEEEDDDDEEEEESEEEESEEEETPEKPKKGKAAAKGKKGKGKEEKTTGKKEKKAGKKGAAKKR